MLTSSAFERQRSFLLLLLSFFALCCCFCDCDVDSDEVLSEDSTSSCDNLAKHLSKKYLSTTKFDNAKHTISEYLETTGILLSMCEKSTGEKECFTNPYKYGYLSGSFIQNSTTGPRVFNFGGLNHGVGIIIDPKAVKKRSLTTTPTS